MAKGITELIRDFKELHPRAYERMRSEAIDEFLKELYPCKYEYNDNCVLCGSFAHCMVFIAEKIADELKEQKQ